MITKASIKKMCDAYKKKHGKMPNTITVNIVDYKALTKIYDLVLLQSGPATFAQREDHKIHFVVDRSIKKPKATFNKDRKELMGTKIVKRKGII